MRTDNAAAVAAVNKAYSSACDLNVVAQLVSAEAASHGITIAARHIPGINNKLADALSRWRPEGPAAHRQLHPDLYHDIVLDVPGHQVDACADPCGSNSFCKVFWSPLQDGLKESWQARRVWCHPPVGLAGNFLQHFQASFAARPTCTSATFVLPAWPFNRLWRHVKGGHLLRHWPAGSPILIQAGSASAYDSAATAVLPWGVVVIEFPAASCRPRNELAAMPRLSGSREDIMLLRGLLSPSMPLLPGQGPSDHHPPGGLPSV